MKKLTLLTVVFVFTISINAQTAIQEFNFNGTFSNTKNDVSFTENAKFVNGRSGAANSAIRVINNYIEATVLDLPFGNSSRTVSVWVKYNDLTNANYIWGYGSSYNARYFGLIQQGTVNSISDLNLAGCGEENDVFVSTEVVPNSWYNYVVTYDGLTSKIYRNGVLIKSSVSPRKLTSGIVFSIGKMGHLVKINADIDDLKIYDVALTDEEVVSLYKDNSSLTTKNVASTNSTSKISGAKAGLAAPVVEGGIKFSEIYSTKGAKVFASNTSIIDISSILDGTYLLQIGYTIQSLTVAKTTSNKSKIGGKAGSSVPDGIKSSEIFSTNGAKVFAGNTNVIDISTIAEGAYLLKVASTAESRNVTNITSN